MTPSRFLARRHRAEITTRDHALAYGESREFAFFARAPIHPPIARARGSTRVRASPRGTLRRTHAPNV
jgi:hypothetical protein